MAQVGEQSTSDIMQIVVKRGKREEISEPSHVITLVAHKEIVRKYSSTGRDALEISEERGEEHFVWDLTKVADCFTLTEVLLPAYKGPHQFIWQSPHHQQWRDVCRSLEVTDMERETDHTSTADQVKLMDFLGASNEWKELYQAHSGGVRFGSVTCMDKDEYMGLRISSEAMGGYIIDRGHLRADKLGIPDGPLGSDDFEKQWERVLMEVEEGLYMFCRMRLLSLVRPTLQLLRHMRSLDAIHLNSHSVFSRRVLQELEALPRRMLLEELVDSVLPGARVVRNLLGQ